MRSGQGFGPRRTGQCRAAALIVPVGQSSMSRGIHRRDKIADALEFL